MAIGVDGGADIAVAKPFPYNFGMDAGLEHEGGMGMSQVMEAQMRDPGPGDDLTEGVAKAAGVKRPAIVI